MSTPVPVVPAIEHSTPPLGVEDQAGDLFFADARFRPDPRDVASLIGQGLSERKIRKAAAARGIGKTAMRLTLQELKATLPCYYRLTEAAVEQHPDEVLLGSGRDGDVLVDILAVTHPEREVYYFPSSARKYAIGDFWDSPGMQNDDLATRFFAQHRITDETLRDPNKKFVILDSGYSGTVKRRLSARLASLFGPEVLTDDKLTVRPVCAGPGALGKALIDFRQQPDGHKPLRLPKSYGKGKRQWPDPSAAIYQDPFAFDLCNSMQSAIPRYHDRYTDIIEGPDGKVYAIPLESDPTVKIGSADSNGAVNIDVLAAAIVQYRVVKYAMQQAGTLPPIYKRLAAQFKHHGRKPA